MKPIIKYTKAWVLTSLCLLTLMACEQKQDTPPTPEKVVEQAPLFPKGQKAPAQFFTGNAWVTGLVENDSIFTTSAGSVHFEAQARSNWHSHPSGQILIVTEGVGYHQIQGQPKEVIRKGDVIQCPPNKVHWHGASKDSSMSHIYIVPNTEKGIVEWMDAVSEEQFLSE